MKNTTLVCCTLLHYWNKILKQTGVCSSIGQSHQDSILGGTGEGENLIKICCMKIKKKKRQESTTNLGILGLITYTEWYKSQKWENWFLRRGVKWWLQLTGNWDKGTQGQAWLTSPWIPCCDMRQDGCSEAEKQIVKLKLPASYKQAIKG